MSEFLPSELRHRMTLKELSRISDEGDGFTESWEELAELWADVRPASGFERIEADRLSGTVSHEIALRYRAGVSPAMRFRKGTRLFQILAVIDVGERKRWIKCLCEEREL